MSLPIISTNAAFADELRAGLHHGKAARQLVFLSFVLLILLHHGFVFLGFYGMDDINYARYAARLASGESLSILTTDHFELRWLAIYATAFFYRVFGINDFSSAAFGIITVLSTGYLILRLLRHSSLPVVIFALLLFFLDYHILFTTHRIWPDSAVMLLLLTAYYCYLQAAAGKASARYPLIFSAALFLAMLAKETVVLFIPLLLFLLISDGIAGRLRRFWLPAVLVSVLLCFGYAGLFKLTTGDWWYRYTVLQWNATATECDFANLPLSNTLRRIGYQLWQAFLLNGDMIVLLMGVCSLIYRKQLLSGRQERELAIGFFVLLLSANFMSISFTAYVPLCHDPRHFLFLLPFAAIPGAKLLVAYFVSPVRFWVLPTLFSAATAILFVTKGGEMKYVYLLVCLVLLMPLLVHRTPLQRVYLGLAPILLAACLLVRPAYDLYRNRFYYFEDHKKLIQTVFTDRETAAMVYTANELTAELSEYFLDFQTGAVQFWWMGRPGFAAEHLRTASKDSLFVGEHLRTAPGDSLSVDEHLRAKNEISLSTTQDSLAVSPPIAYFLLNRETEPLVAETVDGLLSTGSPVLTEVQREGPLVLYWVADPAVLGELRQ